MVVGFSTFDLPAGYSEAKDYQQLMGIQATSLTSGDGGNDALPANRTAANNHSAAISVNADQANLHKSLWRKEA